MKKSLAAVVVLLGTSFLVGRTELAHAASLGNVDAEGSVGSLVSLSTSVVTGAVGDEFNFRNMISGGAMQEDVMIYAGAGDTGIISTGSGTCTGVSPCVFIAGTQGNVTIDQLGTVTVEGVSSHFQLTLDLRAPDAPHRHRRPRRKVFFDFNGGVCRGGVVHGLNEFRGSLDLPTKDDCSKEGYVLVGWTRNPNQTSDEHLLKRVVARSGTLTAVWR